MLKLLVVIEHGPKSKTRSIVSLLEAEEKTIFFRESGKEILVEDLVRILGFNVEGAIDILARGGTKRGKKASDS